MRLAAGAAALTLIAASACSGQQHVRAGSAQKPATKASPAGGADVSTAPWAAAAADPASGAFFWGLPVAPDFQVFSGMVVSKGVLYGQWAGCSGGSGGLAALDVTTGRVRWRTPPLFVTETIEARYVASVVDGVYVGVGHRDQAINVPNVLVGIAASNGKELWRLTDRSPVSVDGPLLAVSGPNPAAIDVISRLNGRTLSSVMLPEDRSLDGVVVDGDRVFLATTELVRTPVIRITAFDGRTGKQLWTRDGITGGITGASGGTLVTTRSLDGNRRGVVAFDEANGAQRWQRDDLTEVGGRQTMAAATAVFQGMGSATEAGPLEVVDLANGRTRWRSPSSDVVAVKPNGVFLVGTGNDFRTKLYANEGSVIGPVPDLPKPGEQQVIVPPEVGPDGHVYLGRGCPGRG